MPGIGCAALAELHERITRFGWAADDPVRRLPAQELPWAPEDWELDRLEDFLAELRATIRAARDGS